LPYLDEAEADKKHRRLLVIYIFMKY